MVTNPKWKLGALFLTLALITLWATLWPASAKLKGPAQEGEPALQAAQRHRPGPSCNTCHAHMAKQVVYSPAETAKLCSRCHDSINSQNLNREIHPRAQETMMALQRAGYMINWARLLLDNGRMWNLPVNQEANEFKTAEDTLREARVKWHSFDLDSVRKQSDEAFLKATKVKDELRRKLGAE